MDVDELDLSDFAYNGKGFHVGAGYSSVVKVDEKDFTAFVHKTAKVFHVGTAPPCQLSSLRLQKVVIQLHSSCSMCSKVALASMLRSLNSVASSAVNP